jgi:hypothetical protein
MVRPVREPLGWGSARRGFGEEPESVLLGDVHIQATVVVWAATAALILSAGL